MLAEGERHHASDYQVKLGEPVHDDVTGDGAYVVVPASMTFKIHDKLVTQTGAFLTVASARFPKAGASRHGPGRRVVDRMRAGLAATAG